jgi:hypothetical protein
MVESKVIYLIVVQVFMQNLQKIVVLLVIFSFKIDI